MEELLSYRDAGERAKHEGFGVGGTWEGSGRNLRLAGSENMDTLSMVLRRRRGDG